MIKLYAWEIPFQRLIMNVRNSELNVLKNSAFLNAGSSFTWTCAPFLVRYHCVELAMLTLLLTSLSHMLHIIDCFVHNKMF